jgi:hypothetical protein
MNWSPGSGSIIQDTDLQKRIRTRKKYLRIHNIRYHTVKQAKFIYIQVSCFQCVHHGHKVHSMLYENYEGPDGETGGVERSWLLKSLK